MVGSKPNTAFIVLKSAIKYKRKVGNKMGGLVTKRFTGFTVNARIINNETEELEDVTVQYNTTRISDTKAKKFIRNMYPYHTVLAVKWQKYDKMYAMPPELFVKLAAEVNPETKQIENPEQYREVTKNLLNTVYGASGLKY